MSCLQCHGRYEKVSLIKPSRTWFKTTTTKMAEMALVGGGRRGLPRPAPSAADQKPLLVPRGEPAGLVKHRQEPLSEEAGTS